MGPEVDTNDEGYTHDEFCDVVEEVIKTITGLEALSFRASPQVYITASTFIRETLMTEILRICQMLPDWQKVDISEGQEVIFSQQHVIIMLVELRKLLSNEMTRRGTDFYAQSVFHLRTPKSLIMDSGWKDRLDLIIAGISVRFGIISLPDRIE